MSMSLEVADTGALTPSINFPAVGNNLSINAGFNLTRSRTHNFRTIRRFSMKGLAQRWESNNNFGECPTGLNYDLAGELGIQKLVDLEFSAPGVETDTKLDKGGAFGGFITFALTRNINSAGPTWRLSNFIGPGNLGRLERKNTHKLTIAFAAKKRPPTTRASREDRNTADAFLSELLTIEDD